MNKDIQINDLTKRAEERAEERRRAYDEYISAICRGAPEAELSRLYWRAAGLTEVLS